MPVLVQRFKTFAHEHDSIPAFHAAYLVGTLLAAAVLNLGFFAVLITLHMCLDYVKYRDLHGYSIMHTLHAMAMESITDIALFFVALTLAVYLHHTFAVAALSGLVRSELTIVWALGMLVPKVKILEHIVAIILNWNAYLHSPHPDLDRPILRVHRYALITVGVCSLLLLLSVGLYARHELDLMQVIAGELALKL